MVKIDYKNDISWIKDKEEIKYVKQQSAKIEDCPGCLHLDESVYVTGKDEEDIKQNLRNYWLWELELKIKLHL